VPEIGRVDSYLRRDHDLLLVRGRLGVVALHVAAWGLEVARVGVCHVDLPGRHHRRLPRLRRPAEAAAILHHPARAIGLIVGVGAALDLVLLLPAALGLLEPLLA
jgi:hypothetical protein